MKKQIGLVLFALFACLMISGCAGANRNTPLPLPSGTPTGKPILTAAYTPTTASLQETPAYTKEPEATPASTAPQAALKAQPANDGSARLRSGPSINHEDLGLLPPSTVITVIGRTPDLQWVQVRLEDGRTGWISITRLTLEGDILDLAIPAELDAHVIKGRALDNTEQPVAGVRINAIQTYGLKNLVFESVTGEDGWFYFFLPEDTSGTWIIEVVGILCESRIAGPGCVIPGEFERAGRDFVSLPQSNELTFIYQQP